MATMFSSKTRLPIYLPRSASMMVNKSDNSLDAQLDQIKREHHFAKLDLQNAQHLWSSLTPEELRLRIENAHQKLQASEQQIRDIRNNNAALSSTRHGSNERAQRFMEKIEDTVSKSGLKDHGKKDLLTIITAYLSGENMEDEEKINQGLEVPSADDSTISIDFSTGNVVDYKKEQADAETQHRLKIELQRALSDLKLSQRKEADLEQKMEHLRQERDLLRSKNKKLERELYDRPALSSFDKLSLEQNGTKPTYDGAVSLSKDKQQHGFHHQELSNKQSHALNSLERPPSPSVASSYSDNHVWLNTVRGKIQAQDLVKVWLYDSQHLRSNRKDLRDKISFMKLQETGYKMYIESLENILKEILPETRPNQRDNDIPKKRLQKGVYAIYFIICARKQAKTRRMSAELHKQMFV